MFPTPTLLTCAIAVSFPLAAHHDDKHDIVDTAVAAGSFETLATALKAAKLIDALKGDGPFTVFAPSDEAFAKLPKGTVKSLLQRDNRDALRAILTYHVVPGAFRAADVVKLDSASTLNGQRASIEVNGGKVRVAGANVVKTDIECSNGVIHVIDSVLMPSTADIVSTASKAGKFKTLLAAAKAAALAEALAGDGPLTVFAPTDDAFAKLPDGTVESLLKRGNRDKLAAILKYHVVSGRVFAEQALAARRAATLQTSEVEFALRNGRLQVNEANVIANDIQASNGVIHVIDSVLMPPAPRGRKLFGLTYETPSSALAAQLGLERNRSLVVSSLTRGANAVAAGLKRYDVIVEIAGRPASSANLTRAKRDADYGEAVEFKVLRRGKTRTVSIPVGEAKH